MSKEIIFKKKELKMMITRADNRKAWSTGFMELRDYLLRKIKESEK